MKQILIVEDDSFLNKMLDYNLTKPQQFPKENFGEGDIFSPAVYYL